MNKLTDNDIREALKRREARRTKPEVPADFCADIMQEIASKPVHRTRFAYITALAAVAASILLLIVLHIGKDEKVVPTQTASKVVAVENTVTPDNVKGIHETSRVLPVKAIVRQAKRTDRPLVVRQNAAAATDSLDYYINKIERELAQVDDSLYIERIHRVMHADERLQRIVNDYILNELHKDAKSSEANHINNVKTNDYEE